MGNVSKTALFVSTISRQHDILMGSLYSVFCESTTAVTFFKCGLIKAGQHPNDFAYFYSLWIIQRWNGSPVINLLLPLTLLVSTLAKLSGGWSNISSKNPEGDIDIITFGKKNGMVPQKIKMRLKQIVLWHSAIKYFLWPPNCIFEHCPWQMCTLCYAFCSNFCAHIINSI